MRQIIKSLLLQLGEDADREGLKDTPERVERMYSEFFYGYNDSKKPKIAIFSNEKAGENQMVIDKGYFYSFCEHHLMPFFGTYYFAYIPDKKIIGLSKISRIVDFYASRLQIQERLTSEIADELEMILEPKGLALVIKARHLCKEMRGVKKHKVEMITRQYRGDFTKSKHKTDFLAHIKALHTEDLL